MTNGTKQHRLKTSGRVYRDQLAGKMYGRIGCIMELVRNGWAAGMARDPERATRWNHREAAEIEIWLEKGTLLIMDRGLGFTPLDLERFFHFGPKRDEPLRNGGGNQNQMGRMAALGLSGARDGEAIAHWLTRTAATGPVTQLTISERLLEAEIGAEERTLSADDPLLGRYRGIRGSFTVVVIPSPIVTAKELFEKLPARLPRGADRAVKIALNGEPLSAPRVSGTPIALGSGMQTAFLHAEAATEGNEDGIALCDEDSGLPICFLPEVRVKIHPLNRPDVTGYLRYPGLLAHMESSRKGLDSGYWESEEGAALYRLLTSRQARQRIDELVGDRTAAHGKAAETFKEVCELFVAAFGPASGRGNRPEGTRPPYPEPEPEQKPNPDAPPREGGTGGGGGGGGGTRPGRSKTARFRIGNKDYYFEGVPNKGNPEYASLSGDGQAIEINHEHPFCERLGRAEFFFFAVQELTGAVAKDLENGGSRTPRDARKRQVELTLQALSNAGRRRGG